MATVYYNIASGLPNFVVELTPSLIPNNTHTTIGTFQFSDVPNGDYLLRITDANNCVFEQEITVNPFVTTTTTTISPTTNIIVVGNTNDEVLIFNENGTNRPDHYIGFPLEEESRLFLWFKTYDGSPLNEIKILNYSIEGPINTANTIELVENGDEIFSEVHQVVGGPNLTINGQLILKDGFIETYIKYKVKNNSNNPSFKIVLNSPTGDFNLSIPLISGVNVYGTTYVNANNVILDF